LLGIRRRITLLAVSLRPQLSGFELSKMRALFGCRDPNIKAAVNIRVRKRLPKDDHEVQLRAREYVDMIVSRGTSGSYPHGEDEIFQLVVNSFAHEGQEHLPSQSLFWEHFFVTLAKKRVTCTDRFLQLALDGLIAGTPLFGRANASKWSYYALMSNEAAGMLPDLVSGIAELRDAFGVEEAMRWLNEVSASGRDVWCWVS
jgi:hypothetical protein